MQKKHHIVVVMTYIRMSQDFSGISSLIFAFHFTEKKEKSDDVIFHIITFFLYKTSMFLYVWRIRFVSRDISVCFKL